MTNKHSVKLRFSLSLIVIGVFILILSFAYIVAKKDTNHNIKTNVQAIQEGYGEIQKITLYHVSSSTPDDPDNSNDDDTDDEVTVKGTLAQYDTSNFRTYVFERGTVIKPNKDNTLTFYQIPRISLTYGNLAKENTLDINKSLKKNLASAKDGKCAIIMKTFFFTIVILLIIACFVTLGWMLIFVEKNTLML